MPLTSTPSIPVPNRPPLPPEAWSKPQYAVVYMPTISHKAKKKEFTLSKKTSREKKKKKKVKTKVHPVTKGRTD
jgi:hypothetical protein